MLERPHLNLLHFLFLYDFRDHDIYVKNFVRRRMKSAPKQVVFTLVSIEIMCYDYMCMQTYRFFCG
jgi:hypothetical protein